MAGSSAAPSRARALSFSFGSSPTDLAMAPAMSDLRFSRTAGKSTSCASRSLSPARAALFRALKANSGEAK